MIVKNFQKCLGDMENEWSERFERFEIFEKRKLRKKNCELED
jgi:hypothetical protein